MKSKLKNTGDKPWECELTIKFETVEQFMLLLNKLDLVQEQYANAYPIKDFPGYKSKLDLNVWEQIDSYYHQNKRKIDEECDKYTRAGKS